MDQPLSPPERVRMALLAGDRPVLALVSGMKADANAVREATGYAIGGVARNLSA